MTCQDCKDFDVNSATKRIQSLQPSIFTSSDNCSKTFSISQHGVIKVQLEIHKLEI